MTTIIRRKTKPLQGKQRRTTTTSSLSSSSSLLASSRILAITLITIGIVTVICLTSSLSNRWGGIDNKGRRQLDQYGLHRGGGKNNNNNGLPLRVRELIRRKQTVGDRIIEIKAGKATVEEILHGVRDDEEEEEEDEEIEVEVNVEDEKEVNNNNVNVQQEQDRRKDGKKRTEKGELDKYENKMNTKKQPPMTMEEISERIMSFLHQLHNVCKVHKNAKFWEIWQAYHDLTIKTIYPWDQEYLKRMPTRRNDDSIFVSLASYRDENCLNTIKGAYEKSKNPDKLNVGLVQQNCEANCRSGVLSNLQMEDVEPDEDCHKLFCESELGKPHCEAGRVRALHIDEDESLGPYAARYFASKLWYGEQWYMQIDSHMFFAQDWDALSVEMLRNAPAKKPVISHYPPPHTVDLTKKAEEPAPRLCGPVFATSDLEAQIIRLEGSGNYDKKKLEVPRFAPFTAAGYFVAHSDFLREVPFDPFLPWIFMGEEIIMSARLWTSGYDIFSPTQSVLSHIYVRRHKPKFWESVHRVFTYGVHNPLQMLILNRVKYQLNYPEAARDMIKPKSILTAVESYSMGKERLVSDYLQMVGLNMKSKEVNQTAASWCEKGIPPPGYEQYAKLYA